MLSPQIIADKLQLVLKKMRETEDELENVNDRLKFVEEQLEAASTEEMHNRVSREMELAIRHKINLLRQMVDLSRQENILRQKKDSRYRHAAPSVERFWKKLPSATFLCDAVEPPDKEAITVMVSSPCNNNYNDYVKRGAMRLWMGPWSLSELKVAREAMFPSVDVDEVLRLYARWGGIPRFVLECANNSSMQEQFDEAIAVASPELIYRAVGNIEAAPAVSHKLLHIQVDEECNKVGLVFGSEEIRLRLRQLLMHSAWLGELLLWSAGKSELASLRGQLFECAAQEALSKGGMFRVRSLSNPGQRLSPLKVPRMELKLVQDSDLKEMNLQNSKSGLLMVPVAKNFPAVDSFLFLPASGRRPRQLLFIQVTVAAHAHPINASALNSAIQKLSGSLQRVKCNLYFAVPPDQFDSFTKQHVDGPEKLVDTMHMEQFAIEIPLPANCLATSQRASATCPPLAEPGVEVFAINQ
ncbi:hypothetical protein VOLCADRAFT_91690 [Volvox carteri f. nagariensis]|uniref:Uncharacterized protein n=1 Tax=Volvox carteri f. nagariensis TaxID=3068 RepID=D8TXR1_VOLCA|nr:uncharacterized protein VOLCADRAFT_91690 [Volvox carteri f. nagariensis]EFJ47685.1 hypothetical protein VOLCADRAFT_91690 [Volvox carteri f. nagariensis]|eukprot:XP_002951156.1 hypothetical protein VOLCADRAFT_91690 [Volvox carteri f. nagariensis]